MAPRSPSVNSVTVLFAQNMVKDVHGVWRLSPPPWGDTLGCRIRPAWKVSRRLKRSHLCGSERQTHSQTEETEVLGRRWPLELKNATLAPGALIDGDRPCLIPSSRLEIPGEHSYWE